MMVFMLLGLLATLVFGGFPIVVLLVLAARAKRAESQKQKPRPSGGWADTDLWWAEVLWYLQDTYPTERGFDPWTVNDLPVDIVNLWNKRLPAKVSAPDDPRRYKSSPPLEPACTLDEPCSCCVVIHSFGQSSFKLRERSTKTGRYESETARG